MKIKIYSRKFIDKDFWSNHNNDSAIKQLYPNSIRLFEMGFDLNIVEYSHDEHYRDIEIWATHYNQSYITWLLLTNDKTS